MTLQRLMLVIVLFSLLLPGTAAAEILVVDVTIWPNETMKMGDVDITQGTISDTKSGPYTATLETVDGSTYHTTSFRLSYPLGDSTLRHNSTTLRMPYHPNVTRMYIAKDGTTIGTTQFTDHFCTADGFCRPYCQGRQVDPDCGEAQNAELPLLPLAAIIAVTGIGAVLYRRS